MNDNNKNRKLEDFVSKSLQSINDEPSDAVWGGLEMRLDAKDGHPKKGWGWWWPFSILLIGVGLFGFWAYTIYSMNQKLNSAYGALNDQKEINVKLEKEILACAEENNKIIKISNDIKSEKEEIKKLLAKNNSNKPSYFRYSKNELIPANNFKIKKDKPFKSDVTKVINEGLITNKINDKKEEKTINLEEVFETEKTINNVDKNVENTVKKDTSPIKLTKDVDKINAGFILEEEAPKSINTNNSIIDPVKKNKWEIGVIYNLGLAKYPEDRDYFFRSGIAANLELKNNWLLILGKSVGLSDYEVSIPPFATGQERQELLNNFPDIPQAPDPMVFIMDEIDVRWRNLDFSIGLQKRWIKPSGMGLYAETLIRPTFQFYRDYSFRYHDMNNFAINTTVKVRERRFDFQPLNFEVGAGIRIPINKRISSQLGLYYQPSTAEYGKEKISFEIFGLKSAFWID